MFTTNIPKKAPHVSNTTSLTFPSRPGTNTWWISSLTAYKNENIKLIIDTFIVLFFLISFINKFAKYTKLQKPSAAYSLKCPNFLINKLLDIFEEASPGWFENKNIKIQITITILSE